MLKEVYDRSLQVSFGKRRRLVSSSSSAAEEEAAARREKKQALPLWLGLKQQGRSVKYMSQAERARAAKVVQRAEVKERRLKEARNSRGPQGELNGEWEFGHDFVCTVCCQTYDELREVLHHKWDAHPFCLVAHVTLGHSIR